MDAATELMPVAVITERAGGDGNPLTDPLRAAFADACAGHGVLPAAVLELVGMSGRKYRQCVNGLMRRLDAPRYLEVGVWAGSTLCAALHGNPVRATAIDDWSKWGGPREAFLRNVSALGGPDAALVLIESDFRLVDFTDLPAHDVYLFDGPHDEEDQYDGVVYAQPALADRHVLIVDDWNYDRVRRGTFRAIGDLGLRLDHAIEVRTTTDGTHPKVAFQGSDWHNGYLLAALSRP